MAKTSGELELEFIQSIKEKTGKSLSEWQSIIGHATLLKQNEILDYLKKNFGLNHLQAQLIAGIYLNNGQPVYTDENNLLENQFLKCQDMRSLFEQIKGFILNHFEDTQLIAKKTYISFTAKREFAALNIKPKEIRLGLDLGDEPFADELQKSKLTGPMPRISHMFVITHSSQVNESIMKYLKISYNKTNK